MTDSLAATIGRLGRPEILVVGDVILDRYVWGTVERVSPEAPIQILDVTREEFRPGGAGNVAANLVRLEARVSLVGVVGSDPESAVLLGLLREWGIDVEGVLPDPERPTTVKTRMIAASQQVLRVDRERREGIGPAILPRILSHVRDRISRCAAVVVSDYSKGLLAPELLAGIMEEARRTGVPVLVDPKGIDFARYRGAYLLTPNRPEAERVAKEPLDTMEALARGGERLRAELGLPALVVTLGKDGVSLFRENRPWAHFPAKARAVYDVTGAGDTVLSVLGLCVACGADLEDAVRIANVAGGIVVGKLGVAQVSRLELQQELLLPAGLGHVKILSLTDLVRALEDERRLGRRIVFTNGCFDLLHPGHLAILEFCRSKGDVVVVGVNSDASIARLKGPTRPILGQAERTRVLAGLSDVDYVVVYDEDTPAGIVEKIRPHVLVKGEDWKDKGVVGRETVEREGGEVLLCPLAPGLSTSGLIDRILSKYSKK
ncbi:MAG: D-glycero-beta-D-manno-heptose-7-phosphate kinase [Planctomycetes bacterium]|nr:D-glycero-beta-D-manno-heptose-7-phosphate kinase [Planctomycetota bacterium]